ncbi:Urease accessory protein UreD [Cladophialophora carrionii]|uniref:Urease accessory protein UreD n=1 Tax=Cladophialophora carrionii TaxID=86049 RepID=A0A1C1C8N3_9EURO|nr:Urease accessory protein UreD [Cladophialophora carrionii]
MSLPISPFAASSAAAGTGEIILALLPPGRQALQKCTYQYPLKLIAPDPHHSSEQKHVTIVFLLTYGGGLVGGDQIDLKAELQDGTRLVLLTQGSTKIFKSPEKSVVSGQTLNVTIGAQAALCYLPDPTQPFAESVYDQKQTFTVQPDGTSSLLVLDWVSEGRRARGESWTLWNWKGKNEVREFNDHGKGRLLLRDAVMLCGDDLGGMGLVEKSNKMGIFGTLIVYGPIFKKLGEFLLREFSTQPRIGAKNWTTGDGTAQVNIVRENDQAKQIEQQNGLLWTAANVRGFVLVKFGAKEIDGARRWLGTLLRQEGSVEKVFGHQALLCLR